MYTAFYGLFEKPFSLSPDPRYLFFADGHREALAHLRYGIDQGEGFIAVTGEVGTGKSTLCRALIEGLGEDTELAFLFNPPRSATELLQAIAHEFGLVPAGHQRHGLNDQLNQFLVDRKQQGLRVLLIIDEAQNLDTDVLEEIRLLSNLETANSKLIQIVLLGQPELDRKLDSRELRQLRERISVRWFLGPLSREEAGAYVAHRLQVAAGEKRDVFTPGALREIFRRSGGIPRRINLLADRCLLAGFGASEHQIGRAVVRRAAAEIEGGRAPRRLGASWLNPRIALAAALLFVSGAVGAWVGQSASVGNSIENIGLDSDAQVVAPVVSAGTHTTEVGKKNIAGETATADTQLAILNSILTPKESAPVRENEMGESETVYATAAAAIDAQDVLAGTKAVAPGPVGSRGDRLRNTILPGNFLGRLLDSQDATSAREAALVSIFDAYAMPRDWNTAWEVPTNDEETVALIESRGLHVLRFSDADLDELRELNHPVLMTIRTELGDTRTVALRQLGTERATFLGVTEEGALEVSLSEVEHLWDGEALVVWEPFETIPNVLVRGQRGNGVIWLQRVLGELGVYSGAATGTFDESTERSVRILQADAMIEPDGAVGPRTQMVLYDKLRRYEVPRLKTKEGSG
ncbi:MAG: AAA family ATPase [Myxococcota bacterium]|nr:AAA family ATPase [Myxococcota bacterium]